MMYLKETCIKLNMQNILKATFLPLGAYKVFKFNKLMFSLIFSKDFYFFKSLCSIICFNEMHNFEDIDDIMLSMIQFHFHLYRCSFLYEFCLLSYKSMKIINLFPS